MNVIKWFVIPRLSYLDCMIAGVCFSLSSSIGWWALVAFILGIFVSVITEKAVRA